MGAGRARAGAQRRTRHARGAEEPTCGACACASRVGTLSRCARGQLTFAARARWRSFFGGHDGARAPWLRDWRACGRVGALGALIPPPPPSSASPSSDASGGAHTTALLKTARQRKLPGKCALALKARVDTAARERACVRACVSFLFSPSAQTSWRCKMRRCGRPSSSSSLCARRDWTTLGKRTKPKTNAQRRVYPSCASLSAFPSPRESLCVSLPSCE